MSAVAEEAGVTRLTLYRHFPTRDELFVACMGHWRALHPPPDPDAWRRISDFETRARHALRELYAWFEENGDELFPIYRDRTHTPAATQAARDATNARMVDALLYGSRLQGGTRRRTRAAAGHVVGFWTWRSLVVDQGLTIREAVDLAVGFLDAASRPGRP